jgi:hypothetical protein
MLLNPGFETGNFFQWGPDLGGLSAAVVTNWTGATLNYLPPEGNYFAVLGSTGSGGVGGIFQDVNLTAGQTLAGEAAFDDWGPGYSEAGAFVDIHNETTSTDFYPWSASDGSPGLPGPSYSYPAVSGPWTPWQFIAPADGTYQVSYIAVIAPGNTANALFDAQPTPEPGTCALVLLGLPGLAWLRRKRSA